MLSVDPAYTLGRLAEARELLLNRLRAEGAIGRNAALAVPEVPLRVGLVTSAGSAAAADFLRTLEASGFGWQVLAVDARVQGVDAERSVVAALRRCSGVDVVCVVRGGGARTDLAAFDSEVVARAIAATPFPVFTGIGHETDTTVADTVAHTAFKTPTACAAALVERVQDFAGRCSRGWERVRRAAAIALDHADRHLDRASGRAVGAARHHLRAHEHRVAAASRALANRAPRPLAHATVVVDGFEARVRAVDPASALARGWTLTRRADGSLVRSARQLADGELIATTFADGTVASRVEGDVDG
jgi:exodeoxyribonuclease VII large subunit